MELLKEQEEIQEKLNKMVVEIDMTVIEKENKIIELIELRSSYNKIEEDYKEELDGYIEKQDDKYSCFNWLKT